MTEEQKELLKAENKIISFNNKIAVDKKSYFFGYVYTNLKKENDNHIKNYKSMCKQLYHCSISQLQKKVNKTEEENKLIRNYYKYMPLLKNNCIMNVLTYYIENTEFENKWANHKSNFDYRILLSKYFEPTNKRFINNIRQAISDSLKKYTKEITSLNKNSDIVHDKDYLDAIESSIYQNTRLELEQKLISFSSNMYDITNYMIYCYYNYFNNKSKSWLWDICGKYIVDNLKMKTNEYFIPVEDESGTEYLGKKYILESVNIENGFN